jgi:putative ATP-dependent endonuclease of OLD family
LLKAPLAHSAQNALRRLFVDERARVVEALMYPRVLVPEGKTDYEWLRILVEVEDTSGFGNADEPGRSAPFGSVVGVVPTPDSQVTLAHQHLQRIRHAIVVLVDGDRAGNDYVRALLASTPPPSTIIQWPQDWGIEHVVGWILDAAPTEVLLELEGQIDPPVTDLATLVTRLQDATGPGHLKGDILSYERIGAAVRAISVCSDRAWTVLDALTRAALGEFGSPNLVQDGRSTPNCGVVRFTA